MNIENKFATTLIVLVFLFSSSVVNAQSQAHQSRFQSGRGAAGQASLEAIANWNGDSKLIGKDWPEPPYNISPRESISPSDCKTGDVVELSYWRFRVVQILDDESLIISLADSVYWVEGTDTTAVSDGERIRIATPVLFIDRKEYATTKGSKKIVKAMRMIPQKEFKQTLKKSQNGTKIDPPGASKSKERTMREWTSKDGKFTTQAKFLSRGGSKITLEKEDGKQVTLELEKLSEADGKYVNALD